MPEPFWKTQPGEMLLKHDKDLYRGDGKDNPSFNTRLCIVEDIVKEYVYMKRLMLGILLSVITDIVVRLVK